MKIEFDKVAKRFGDLVALDHVSLEINKGEFVFITGKSGAGKSTIVRLIMGEYRADSGDVWVDGILMNKAKVRDIIKLRRKMGVIYQDFRLLKNKTVKENILIALDIVGYKDENWLEHFSEVLKKVGLEGKDDFFPAQLSGGELQRVCLARALIVKPKVLIADEPTGNLDPEHSWQLIKLLKKINKDGTTVIMATHNFDIVNSMGKRVIKIDKSKLVSDKKKGKYE